MNVTDWYQAEDAEPRQWYSVQNAAGSPTTATVEIYDDIIPFYGVNAADFRNELQALGEGIDTIDLHIHSRGGNVYEAVAIMNTLRQHPARVVTTVDSIAASAAGFIAVGASDELIMADNAELMAHLPWVMAIGDAQDLRKSADRLDQIGSNIASIFADRAGGSVDDWLQVLTDETWWSAQEAVDAGVADRVLKAPKKKPAASGAAAKNRLDLSVFNHAGRSAAPAPRGPQTHETPRAEPSAGVEKGKEPTVALSESALQKLGLDADADDSAIEAAITALAEKETVVVNNVTTEPTAEDLTNAAAKFGLKIVDSAAHDALMADVQALKEVREQQQRDADEHTISTALREGRIAPASADTWRNSLSENREQTTALLSTLPANSIPVAEVGHGVGSEETIDAEMAGVFAKVTGTEYGKGN